MLFSFQFTRQTYSEMSGFHPTTPPTIWILELPSLEAACWLGAGCLFTWCFPSSGNSPPGRCVLCSSTPRRCVPGLLADYALARFPFQAHLFPLFRGVHVNVFNTRPGISGSFLTKLCLFFPCFFLPLLGHPCLSCRLIPVALQRIHHCSFKYPRLFTGISFSLKVLFSGGVIF